MREDRRDVYYMVREQVLTLTNGAGNLEDGKIHSGKHGTYGAA
jgi:hypothetical protein